MSRNTNQLSVAELLARNGQQPATGGGRRRRGGRGVPVEELSGDLPVVENGASAHAAPDTDDAPAGYDAGGPGGYAPDGYAGEQVSYPVPDANYSPMSGPISVYNPLAPYGDPGAGDAPARLGDPSGGSWPEPAPAPEAEDTRPAGRRRRRAEPDEESDGDGANRSWETGPPAAGGGRAARRRAAEAAEAAAAAEAVAEAARQAAPEAPAEYGRPDFGGFAPDFAAPDFGSPAAAPDFGRPDAGPSWPDRTPGFEAGPPRLGPPGMAPTETWQPPDPGPVPENRPELQRRRRGANAVPEPAPWPEDQRRPEDAAAEQATVMWPAAEPAQRPQFGPPPVEESWHRPGFGPGGHEGHPAPPAPGYPEPDGPGDFAAGFDSGSYATDMFATDVHGPMPPVPGPMPRDLGPETGDFESDFASEPDLYDEREESEESGESASRLGRGRAALTGRLGAASGKFTGTRKFAEARERLTGRDRAENGDGAPVDPRKQWIMLGVQSVGAALVGMVLFKGFEQLWEMQPLAALALAVVVILGLVALVRILRRTDDMFSTVIAVVVGVFVTLGPLAFLLSTG
ncbi:hypothetical protein [Nocardia sp. NPDC003345]